LLLSAFVVPYDLFGMSSGHRAVGSDASAKKYLLGTHRIVEPDVTVARMRPFMPLMGITRIADVTGLDRLGIPVTIVCRPNSRSVAVSQGKGTTLAAAEASGLMESIESYHAERITLPLKYAGYEELRYSHPMVDLDALPRMKGSRFHPCLPILWIEGENLLSGERSWLPFELAHTNFSKPMPTGSGCFPASSNGLASGNHELEALCHGISEVIERDSTALWYARRDHESVERRVRLETITDPACRALLETFEAKGVDVAIWETTTDIGVPSFYCWIMEREDRPRLLDRPTVGAGCHPAPPIALSRALTEAAQDRLTLITGARDDLKRGKYQGIAAQNVFDLRPERSFPIDAQEQGLTIQEDLDLLLGCLRKAGLSEVLAIRLMKPEFGDIPVVRIVIPGLEGLPDQPSYLPGRRAQKLLSNR